MLVIVSDKKLGIASSSNSSLIDHYEADVVSAQDYYPFGMLMPGRRGYASGTGWNSGSPGSMLPANPSYSSRTGNTPLEYKATESIEFTPGFESGEGDMFEAYTTQGTSSGDGSEVAGSGAYRYGFNGKERDGSVYENINIYDYGFRIYNPSLGKFLSTDPLFKSYPELTPYQFASNMPISSVDLDGLESKFSISTKTISDSRPKTDLQKGIEANNRYMTLVEHVHKNIVLKAKDLKSQEKTPMWLSNANLSIEEYDLIITETIKDFLKTDSYQQIDFSDFKLYDKTVADFDYEKYSNRFNGKSISEVKDLVKSATTIYSYHTDVVGTDEIKQKAVKFGQMANDLVEGNYQEVFNNTITFMAENIDKVASKFITPVIAARFGAVVGNMLIPAQAPSGGNSQELKTQYVTNAVKSTIASMLFYFMSGNKVEIKELPKISDVDNTHVDQSNIGIKNE